MTGIREIEQACTDERLLERAAADCADAFARYALAGHSSTHDAIGCLVRLTQQLDEARLQAQAVRAQRRPVHT